MIMVKMYLSGITLEVPEKEVDLYKRAGYVVVQEVKPEEQAIAQPVEPEKKPAKSKKE